MRRSVVLMLLCAAISAAPLSAQETQVDSDLKFGIELFKNQMYDLAEEQFNKFLQQYPSSPSAGQARYYLALAQFDQKKYSDAAGNFQTFAAQFPNDPQAPGAWMSAGESYAMEKDFANAGLSFERLKVFYPKDPQAPGALLKAAKYFQLSGDTSRAELSLISVVQDYSSTSAYFTATLQLGNLYFESKRLTKAENQYKALLSSDNDSVRVMGLLALGNLNKLTGATETAEKYYSDAAKVGIEPQSTDAILGNIEIDLEAGNYSHALESANGILSSNLTADQRARLDYETDYGEIGSGNANFYKKNSSKIKSLPWNYRVKIAALMNSKAQFADGVALLKNFPAKDLDYTSIDLYAELAFHAGNMSLADSLLHLYMQLSRDTDARRIVKLLDMERSALANPGRASKSFVEYQDQLKDRPDALLFYRALEEESTENFSDASQDLSVISRDYPESDYASAADSANSYIGNSRGVDYRSAVVQLADILLQQGISSTDKAGSLFQLGKLYENVLKDHDKAATVFGEIAAISTGDTQRVADFMLATALENAGPGKLTKESKPFAIYRELATDSANDSISEKSLYKVMKLQAQFGDSVAAETTAMDFLKRFPGSPKAEEVYCLMASALYNSGAYHEAVVQASLALPYPEANVVMAKSEIAIDSLDAAGSLLENFISSGPPKSALLKADLIRIDLLKKMNADAGEGYIDLLGELVPSRFKDSVATQYANYLYSTSRFDSAYSVYSTIGRDDLWHRTPPSLVYNMAYCKLKTGDLNAARDLFQEVASRSRTRSMVSDSYLQLGNIYKSLGDSKMSAAFFEKAGSGDTGALLNAAETYFKLGDYDNASEIYKKLSGADQPDSVKQFCLARLIEIDYKNGDIKIADEKAAKFRKTYKKGSDEYLAKFLIDKSEYLIGDKKYEEAGKLLDDVKSDYDETSSYPVSLLDRARILVEQQDLDKAQEVLTELLSKYSGSQSALEGHLELGNILYAKEKYQDAADNFRMIYLDSLADRTLMRDAMARLVSSYESLGLYDGALEVSRKFVAMFPDDKSIMDMRIKIGILYEELKYFDQALLTFQALAKDANRDYQAELHYYVGAIYDDKADYPNAILEFLKVPYLVTPSAAVDWAAQAYYSAGKCYEKLNKPNDAIAMYQKIVDKPNTDPTFVAGAQREINRVKALLK